MKKNFGILLIIFSLVLFCLTGCSNDSSPGVSDGGGNNSGEIVDKTTSQKIIYTVDYDLECADINECMEGILNKSKELSGYVLTSRVSNNYASYTIKVPTSKLDEFLNYIDGLGNTANKSITTDDVTSKYNMITSEIEVLEARREAYINMLKNNSLSLSDELEINKALDEVSSRLQSLYYDKAVFDSKVDYSTINIGCEAIENQGFFTTYAGYLRDFFVGIGKGVMYILPILIIGWMISVVIIIVDKKRKKKKIESTNDGGKNDNA